MAEDSNCWWQINLNAHPQYDSARLRSDPAYCAQAAFEVWQGAGWDAWSTYKNGSYLAFVDVAQQPVAPPPAAAPPPVVAGNVGPIPAIPAMPAGSSPWLLLGAAALALWAIGEL